MAVKVEKVRLTAEGQARRDKCEREGLCLGCLKPIVGRKKVGLHPDCYSAVLRNENAGKITRKELLREGRILPATNKGGRPPTNPVSKELAKR